MRKTFIAVLILFMFAVSTIAIAQPPAHAKFKVPVNAIKIDDNVYGLGRAVTDGVEVEGYMFIHRKDVAARSNNAKNRNGGSTCYAYLASGAKWKSVENWIVNPSNAAGLDPGLILGKLSADISTWEAAAGRDILGTGTSTGAVLSADASSPDNVNEVYFADIDSPGVIAVTTVWGVFSGPVQNRRLVEWDQIYDDVDFEWSFSGEVAKMDFDNIATHEIGHAMGMGHPSDGCTEETMYRFAGYNETKKRTLNAGDIEGIKSLYK